MSHTRSTYISILAFMAFCAVLYTSSGASLTIISKMYTLVWLCVMTLFPLSLLLLKFNHGRLPRVWQTSLWVIFCTFIIALIIVCGNIAIDPTTAGRNFLCCFVGTLFSFYPYRYFAAYFLAVAISFSATQNKMRILGWVYWTYNQNPILHMW